MGGNTQKLSLLRSKMTATRVEVAAKINQRKLLKSLNCSCHLKYNKGNCIISSSDGQKFRASVSIPCHAIFIFLDPLLLGVLQVEYQNKNKPPSATHPIQIQTFLMAICIYCMVLGIKLYRKDLLGCYQEQILTFILLAFGSISSASLLSILLNSILFWLVIIIWGSIPIIMGHHLLKYLLYWTLGMVEKLNLKNKFSTMISVFKMKAEECSNNNNLAGRVEGI
ncbi:hypothetical protein S83_039735 [Arachis hypogaea]